MLDALSHSNLFLVPLDEGAWYRFHPLFAQLLRVELERREPGTAPALHRRAYAWHRDHGTTSEAIRHAIAAGAHAEAAELIEASWVSYANASRHDPVLAWFRQLPQEMSDAATRALAGQGVDALALREAGGGERGNRGDRAAGRAEAAGHCTDGFSSAEASLTMLRAAFLGETSAYSLEMAAARLSLKGPGVALASPLACSAVGIGLYFRGELAEADRWFAESAALASASAQWQAGASSLAYRSLAASRAS